MISPPHVGPTLQAGDLVGIDRAGTGQCLHDAGILLVGHRWRLGPDAGTTDFGDCRTSTPVSLIAVRTSWIEHDWLGTRNSAPPLNSIPRFSPVAEFQPGPERSVSPKPCTTGYVVRRCWDTSPR